MQTQTTTNTIDRRAVVQRIEDLKRLARKGEEQGIKILVDYETGQHVATSASNPTAVYHVGSTGCVCKGYLHWQKCKHYALWLAEVGMLDFLDSETAQPAVELVDLPDAMVANIKASLECGLAPRSELIGDAEWMVANHLAEMATSIDRNTNLFLTRYVNDLSPAQRETLCRYREARENHMDTARRLVAQIAGGVTVPRRIDVVLNETTSDMPPAA